jgi:hypothetical protein
MGEPIIIEYVLTGQQRGYNITSGAGQLDEQANKALWRSAMPRGTGWGGYVGAQSLKVFSLPDDRIAFCDVSVTDQQDETGRTGIRRAEVTLINPNQYTRTLEQRLSHYPTDLLVVAKARHAKLKAKLPRFKRDASIILTHPYHSVERWGLVEAVMLLLALDAPRAWRGQTPPIPFTTLALDHRGDNPLIALPVNVASQLESYRIG